MFNDEEDQGDLRCSAAASLAAQTDLASAGIVEDTSGIPESQSRKWPGPTRSLVGFQAQNTGMPVLLICS